MQVPPRSVPLGGQRIRIRVNPDLESWGEYFHDKSELHLAPMALDTLKNMRETLRHELMHAALRIGGVAYSDSFQEEAVVRCMETLFFPCWDKLSPKLR